MRPRSRHLAVALAATAAWSPGAPLDTVYPNQRPANDPWLNAIRDEGIKFWAKRGVTVPATTKVDVADDLSEGKEGRGWSTQHEVQGRIALNGRTLGVELRRARSKRQTVARRRAALDRLGHLIFHELGHVGLGEGHQAAGLMSESMGTETPWEARLLARRLIPKPRR